MKNEKLMKYNPSLCPYGMTKLKKIVFQRINLGWEPLHFCAQNREQNILINKFSDLSTFWAKSETGSTSLRNRRKKQK